MLKVKVWDWDEENHIQRLVDINGICEACHNTIHYGRAQKIGRAKEAMEQFMKVNLCVGLFEFNMVLMDAQTDFFRRSEIKDW